MFDYSKLPKKKIEEIQNNESESVPMNLDEQNLVAICNRDFYTAKAARENSLDALGWSIEDIWEDERDIYLGGGLQWVTNFAYRTKQNRLIRPNSEQNYVFNTLQVQEANITASTPDVVFMGVEENDEEIAQILTGASRHNDYKNNLPQEWRKFVYDFIGAGPTIAMITWDNNWIGGRGPQRWIGDVRVQRIDKWEMYFDPAIKDLEKDMQECSYIIRRLRKKVEYIKTTWENGKAAITETEEEFDSTEGSDPKMTYLYEYWHVGYPWYVPAERSKELNQQADILEQEGDEYKSQDYRDAAKGILSGVHVAYICNDVVLEYRPYEYEDGLYPFVFTSKYFDERHQWGFGEIRNIKIPQVILNKFDEIRTEAFIKEGLGGGYYKTGAISNRQMIKMKENSFKSGMWFEVDDPQMMKDRTGAKVPASLENAIAQKTEFINNNQPATTIQQGQMPGANTPYAAVRELGERTDIRMKQVSEKFKIFFRKINELRVNRFIQFYTEERYYRIKGADNKLTQGTIQRDMLMKQYPREEEKIEMMNQETGEMEMSIKQKFEKFLPEFDIKITIISEKPTDRGYYTNLAFNLNSQGKLSDEHLFFVLDEGKLPPTSEILQHLYSRDEVKAVLSEIQKLPIEYQQMILDQLNQIIQQVMQQAMLQQQQQVMEQQTQTNLNKKV